MSCRNRIQGGCSPCQKANSTLDWSHTLAWSVFPHSSAAKSQGIKCLLQYRTYGGSSYRLSSLYKLRSTFLLKWDFSTSYGFVCNKFTFTIFCFCSAPSPKEQQIPDGEQTSAGTAGEERHEGDAGHRWKRGLLVLHTAFLQTPLHWGQCESACLWVWYRRQVGLNGVWDDIYFQVANDQIINSDDGWLDDRQQNWRVFLHNFNF